MHGMGYVSLVDGTVVVGAWVNDKLQGSSTITDSHGTIESVEWDQGVTEETSASTTDREWINRGLVLTSFGSFALDPSGGYFICLWIAQLCECAASKTHECLSNIETP